jgi:phosphoglycolate phosphatase/pyrophosphatase PpaX
MKYKCLVLDHDDTVVNSTATIHYPCFIKFLEDFYPELVKNYTLESFFEKNFHPGVISLFRDEVGMTEEEMIEEEKYWADFVETITPSAFDGMREIISRFKREGGIVAVVSHSLTRYIERDYRENDLTFPDIIYGWDMPKEKRKPSPWCINDLAERYSILPSEILVVDDLKPGYDMA